MEKTLIKGQKVKLSDIIVGVDFYIKIDTNNSNVGVNCILLDNLKNVINSEFISHTSSGTFKLSTAMLPTNPQHTIAFVVYSNDNKSIANVNGIVSIGTAQFTFNGSMVEAKDTAINLCEIYFYDGVWKFAVLCQPFQDISLSRKPVEDVLKIEIDLKTVNTISNTIKGFFGKIVQSVIGRTPTETPLPVITNEYDSISTDLRIRLEKSNAPQLISLIKKANLTLDKVGMCQHKAKVALCLDVSGSMSSLYSSGVIQKFAERMLALGCNLDDDGAIDVFVFAETAAYVGELSIENFNSKFIERKINEVYVGQDTRYATAIKTIRGHYFNSYSERTSPLHSDLPVFVMYVTDGDAADPHETEKQIRWASYEPIFWQFMAINKKHECNNFSFLKKLDTMSKRYIDNANFFEVVYNHELISDDKLYGYLMTEYPDWVKLANKKGLL